MASQELLDRLVSAGLGQAVNHIYTAGVSVCEFVDNLKPDDHYTFVCDCVHGSGALHPTAQYLIERCAPELLPKLQQLRTGDTASHVGSNLGIHVVCSSFYLKRKERHVFIKDDFAKGLHSIFAGLAEQDAARVFAAPFGRVCGYIPNSLRDEISGIVNSKSDMIGTKFRVLMLGAPR